MKKLSIHLKTLVSSLLVLAVLTVFSFTSYAAPDASAKAVAEMPEGEPMPAFDMGILTASGSVSVNGNTAKTGITVLSGSTVSTGENSIAMLDLGPLGRVTVGPHTTATITYTASDLLIKTTCDDMRVAVKHGQCNVIDKNGKSKILNAGEDEHFDSSVNVTANPLTDVVVNCGREIVCPAPIQAAATSSSMLLGILLLGGVATGVTIGVITGGKTKSSKPPASGFQP